MTVQHPDHTSEGVKGLKLPIHLFDDQAVRTAYDQHTPTHTRRHEHQPRAIPAMAMARITDRSASRNGVLTARLVVGHEATASSSNARWGYLELNDIALAVQRPDRAADDDR